MLTISCDSWTRAHRGQQHHTRKSFAVVPSMARIWRKSPATKHNLHLQQTGANPLQRCTGLLKLIPFFCCVIAVVCDTGQRDMWEKTHRFSFACFVIKMNFVFLFFRQQLWEMFFHKRNKQTNKHKNAQRAWTIFSTDSISSSCIVYLWFSLRKTSSPRARETAIRVESNPFLWTLRFFQTAKKTACWELDCSFIHSCARSLKFLGACKIGSSWPSCIVIVEDAKNRREIDFDRFGFGATIYQAGILKPSGPFVFIYHAPT